MPIRFEDIKYRLRPPVDFTKIEDPRGLCFGGRHLINYEGLNLTGCVLYKCYPKVGHGVLEISPASSLTDVSLENANLRGADLEGANLEGAKLLGADLEGANLYEANLYNANLSDADLERANLEGANLKGANLKGTNLENTNLEDANLDGAEYNSNTAFPNTITQEQLNFMLYIEDTADDD